MGPNIQVTGSESSDPARERRKGRAEPLGTSLLTLLLRNCFARSVERKWVKLGHSDVEERAYGARELSRESFAQKSSKPQTKEGEKDVAERTVMRNAFERAQ